MKLILKLILIIFAMLFISYGVSALMADYYNKKLGTNYTPTEIMMGLHRVVR